MSREFHLSDQELLMAVDGELAPRDSRRAESHLAACWSCRVRRSELESAIGEFVRFQRKNIDTRLPSGDVPRALLKARLAEFSYGPHGKSNKRHGAGFWRANWALIAISVLALTALSGFTVFLAAQRRASQSPDVSVPNPSFTPGATVLLSRQQICRENSVKNKAVPKAVQRIVLSEYGIRNSDAGAYEVDYLITPALGGADDIRNLWPQSNRATLWNSQVKDELEDNLRGLVCGGQLDLATAQREIAGSWIQAYKKYFHTERPLPGMH